MHKNVVTIRIAFVKLQEQGNQFSTISGERAGTDTVITCLNTTTRTFGTTLILTIILDYIFSFGTKRCSAGFSCGFSCPLTHT